MWQITRLKQHRFLSPTFFKIQRPYKKNHVYLLFHWFNGENCVIFTFFTQRTTDFDKLKRNMNDGIIIFLMSLLSVLTWKILLLFSFSSFSHKIIPCFKWRVYSLLSIFSYWIKHCCCWKNVFMIIFEIMKKENTNTSSFDTYQTDATLKNLYLFFCCHSMMSFIA